jgi:bifunctional DNA-binding transcriptional regulator/antitoxin component of YhaV-PrlF toxin-antitoxin module
MQEVRTRIVEGGTIIVPVEFWQELSLQPGDEVVIRLEEEELSIFTLGTALRRSQKLVSRYISPDRSLANELVFERRQDK